MTNNKREQELMQEIEKAKAEAQVYFEKVGLKRAFELYFESDAVKAQIHAQHEKMAARIMDLAQAVPKNKQANAAFVAGQIVAAEDQYVEGAKTNMLFMITNMLKSMEELMPMDSVTGAPFKRALDEEADGTMKLALDHVLEEMSEKAVTSYLEMVMGPTFGLLNVLAELIGMDSDEMLNALNHNDDDNGEEEDSEEE